MKIHRASSRMSGSMESSSPGSEQPRLRNKLDCSRSSHVVLIRSDHHEHAPNTASLGRGDRAAVLKLVRYPLRVNSKKALTFRNEASLSKAYDKIFTSQVLATINKAEPAALFCRDGQGMLGDGVIWAGASEGAAKAEVINP